MRRHIYVSCFQINCKISFALHVPMTKKDYNPGVDVPNLRLSIFSLQEFSI